MKNLIYTIFLSLISLSFYGQCMQDECHNVATSLPGCCSGTTVGASPGNYGDFDCLNLGGTSGNNDVWMFFEPAVGDNGNYLQLDIDNITQDGITQWIVFRHESSSSCGSLNSSAQVIGNGCNSLAGDGVGGTTWTDTAAFPLQFGESYWIFLSIDEENGGTPGTFEVCISSVTPPPPTPGQDCITAVPLCNNSATGFTVGNIQAGDGTISEGFGLCLAEQNSQWYTFTASSSGTFEMNVDPVAMYDVLNCAGSAAEECDRAGDDYDFMLLDITSGTGFCPTQQSEMVVVGGTSVGCDYSACEGSTGFGSLATFGLTGSDGSNPNDLCNDKQGCFGGQTSCGGMPQWNATTPNLTAGNTYALMIQNYSGSADGVTVEFAGTAVLGPVSANADFTPTIVQLGCEVSLAVDNTPIPNYTYSWDYGDGSAVVVNSAPPAYNYTTPGTYFATLTVTDSVGCEVSKSVQINVATCSPLPVELVSFSGYSNINSNGVQLEWVTASEINNDYFTIEKSNDGTHFEPLTKVDGSGTITEVKKYGFTDYNPYNGKNYYKLSQTDYNGSKQWYKTISVDHKLTEVVTISPNPSKGIFNFNYNTSLRGKYSLNIFNLIGKEILNEEIIFDGNSTFSKAIDLTSFPKGMYIATFTNGTVMESKRIVIR